MKILTTIMLMVLSSTIMANTDFGKPVSAKVGKDISISIYPETFKKIEESVAIIATYKINKKKIIDGSFSYTKSDCIKREGIVTITNSQGTKIFPWNMKDHPAFVYPAAYACGRIGISLFD